MNAPLLTYELGVPKLTSFEELSPVRLLRRVLTDDGVEVPEGTKGTVVGAWAEGTAYEVEFDLGLATVDVSNLEVIRSRE